MALNIVSAAHTTSIRNYKKGCVIGVSMKGRCANDRHILDRRRWLDGGVRRFLQRQRSQRAIRDSSGATQLVQHEVRALTPRKLQFLHQ